jgi:hypothetical protein
MHRHLLKMKQALRITDEEAVTPIVPIVGGEHPTDGFSLNSAAPILCGLRK